jgi:hypothetical protein
VQHISLDNADEVRESGRNGGLASEKCVSPCHSDDPLNFHVIADQTLMRLESYSARIAENRDVMEALNFARFVINSRLAHLLKAHANEGRLPVDGNLVDVKARELMDQCQRRFSAYDREPRITGEQLTTLHDKLDRLAVQVGQLMSQEPPRLSVVQGGDTNETLQFARSAGVGRSGSDVPARPRKRPAG